MSPRNPFTGEGAVWRTAGAAMLVVTLAGQHPTEQFCRFRMRDTLGLIPNWRFFAPNPSKHDHHFLYRTVGADGTAAPWEDASGIERRRPAHLVWFPTRRADKAVFDACSDLLPALDHGFAVLVRTPAYWLVTEHLRARILASGASPYTVGGFQFALARGTGYDLRGEPQMLFVSPYVPLDPHASTTPLKV
ncbi:hypothetical protein [Streptomyces sp. 4F14]|uniref:hypothetical protein n=1 Tax=Streptomyces sp. 4F14 TaxID=3394380 RepID=UPI003A86D5A1